MFNYYLNVLKNYAKFSGRARRMEFWMFFLCNILVCILLSILSFVAVKIGIILSLIYGIGIIIPGLAVTVRRLHDIGKGGGWIFISMVPVIGGIWYLILMFTAGEKSENRFGPDPKA